MCARKCGLAVCHTSCVALAVEHLNHLCLCEREKKVTAFRSLNPILTLILVGDQKEGTQEMEKVVDATEKKSREARVCGACSKEKEISKSYQ